MTNYDEKVKQLGLLQSVSLIGLGFGIGFLTSRLFNEGTSSPEKTSSRKSADSLKSFDTFDRRKNFISRPFWLPVANPVPTEVYYTPLSSAPHRILLSLPGSPPYERVLPDSNGNRTLVFDPPDNPERTGDLGEVWFECQPLPVEGRIDPYVFFAPQHNESTDTIKVIKFRSDVAEIKFVADLEKPYQKIFQRLDTAHLQQTCVDCGIAVVGAGGSGYPDPKEMARRAAIAAAASKDCRTCLRETGEAIVKSMEEAVRKAQEALKEAERKRQEEEAAKARKEVEKKEKIYYDRSRDHGDVIRMNDACERYERWSHIA